MSAMDEQPLWHEPPTHPNCTPPPLKLWNSLTRSKTLFIPRDPDGQKVTWYACGPTVYDDAHLGHARNYVTTDILRRIMRNYFHFDVKFIMNITDVDDKIIIRARQQHLFADFMAKHPTIDAEVIQTAQLAFSTFVGKHLPLLSSDIQPPDFHVEAEKTYAFVINGGALEGNKKPGSDEAKIKMNIKSGSLAAKTITEGLEEINKATEPGSSADAGSDPSRTSNTSQLTSEAFSKACEDVFLVYLDSVGGSSICGNDYSLFEKLTKNYENRFIEDMRSLNVLDPDELTRVTEYVPEIVSFVEKIVENGFAYSTPDGSVYFDINAFEKSGNYYAKLEPWNRNNKNLQKDGEGSLTNVVTTKRSRNDFALWKASRPGEPSWPSPWGSGRPGWHIECSAMASAKLGDQMDIHSGGIDLAFPHHDNELAQSEACWHGTQWVNYFLHMGHLSIQGSKMSKSLKNFTTIREALDRGTWTSRSLRIVFLLGGWREGIEITTDMINASRAWEEKLNNFFLKAKNFTTPQDLSLKVGDPNTGDTLSTCLKMAQDKVFNALCNSFDTPAAMNAISELVSNFNSAEGPGLNGTVVKSAAKWITSMVNIFGLNGAASPDSPDIGWSGIDVPEYAKPYLNSLSTARDALRQLAKSKSTVSAEALNSILYPSMDHEPIPDLARPYARVLADFKERILSLGVDGSEIDQKQLLIHCDRIRDVDLFDLGVYLEDRENEPALVRPVTGDHIRARQRQAEQRLQAQRRREEDERKLLEKAEKGKLSPCDMFRTSEFSAWDKDGLPTKDSSGNEITKSRSKKLKKDWERQKRAHEAWLTSNSGQREG
ncbi:cysteinyl-tRNA synthetase [Arthroderma uncinatum]|uniref:cysteinyl-tRNA synthetase n=1 Tax=Arthroderma uncinatum TaxID=74035 RepID=UPI00144ACA4A|nr:cysteinyl-tRNA synthetase [Arthroderma uncinatum]KAF3491674.1 cysteinyl-tRNA synthetase [Arthroderma uncinatum]